MLRSGLALGGFCAVSATLLSPALAQDGGLSLTFGLENRLEVSRNIDLSVPATGTDVTNETRLTFGLLSETALDRLQLSLSGAVVAENPADGDTEIDFGRGTADLSYRREVPAAFLELGAFYRSDRVGEFEDALADLDATGIRNDVGGSIALEIGRTASVGLALGAAYEATDFRDVTDPELFDSEVTRAEAALVLHASETATGRIGLRYSLREEEDAPATRTETLTTFVGLDYALSERLDLSTELGYTESDIEEFGVTERTTGPDFRLGLTYDMPAGTASALLTVSTDADEGQRETFEIGRDLETPTATISARLGITHADEGGTDVIGRLSIDRRLPDGSLGLSLERSVTFDDEPEVISLAEVTWTKSVNEVSAISVDFDYALSDAPSERIEQFSVGAAYSRALTADWDLEGGVDYRVRNDADGRAESPTLFVSLNRVFEVRP